jgi:GTPase SAR1 family protein
LIKWHTELKAHAPPGITIAIAANKEDLLEQEEVDIAEVRAFATSQDAVFKYTSAKENSGISSLFSEIA